MSKKSFAYPWILLEGLGGGGDSPGPGPGSGQSSPDIQPYSFEMWQVMFDEYDGDGDGIPGEWDDYVIWMTNNNFASYIDYSEQPQP